MGDVMTNSHTGERFVWRATNESTGGAFCEFDLHLSPGAKVAASHRHLHQTESFEVLTGQVTFVRGVGGQAETHTVAESESLTIPPGVAHSWGNADPAGSVVRVRIAPALRIEDFFAAFCAVAEGGGAGKNGLPKNPLQLAVILSTYLPEIAFPTVNMQRLLAPPLRLVALAGRAFGFSPTPRANDSTS